MNSASTEDWVGRRVVIRGQVQGVGFRWSMTQFAKRLGVRGWVRNRRDGCVEAVLYGPNTDVVAVIHWAGEGPAGAMVDGLEVEEVIEALYELPDAFIQVSTI